MGKSIELDIGLADSGFISSHRAEKFNVQIMAWNAKVLEFSFDNAIVVYDRNPGDLTDFVEIGEPSELLKDSLAREYVKMPESHPYKHYAFLDLDDDEVLSIIATGFQVRILDSKPEAATI